jgi:AMP nucleosidase
VLDEDLPLWVPVPALAEMQVALEQAVGEVTGFTGFDLKRVMQTGTVASVDNSNWELGDYAATLRRLSQSRAIALDMESAAVAASGFRFRVPYGTLLCVSDKPAPGRDQACGHGRRLLPSARRPKTASRSTKCRLTTPPD